MKLGGGGALSASPPLNFIAKISNACEAIDWSYPHEFLDKELQQIVRDANVGKRFAGKLVKVRLLEGEALWILIHIEVQGKREKGFAERMYVYHYRIGDRYRRPVVSLAVLCDPKPKWRPQVFQQRLFGSGVQFEFLVVKLLDFRTQWQALETSTNPFATVIMADLKTLETRRDLPQRQMWKFALFRRLYEQGYDKQDILELFNFIDWVMKLPKELEQAFRADVIAYEEERQVKYVTSIERLAKREGLQEGRKKGHQEGHQEGRQEQTIRLLMKAVQLRFGNAPDKLPVQLKSMTVEELETLMEVALTVDNVGKLMECLAAIAPLSPPNPPEQETTPAN